MAIIKCPDCGKEISELAPACVACGRPMRDSSGAKTNTTEIWLKGRSFLRGKIKPVLVIVTLAIVGMLVISVKNADITEAKKIVEKSATSPTTLKFMDARLIAKEQNYRMVYLVFDSQNKFGATIRTKACVTFYYEGADWKRWDANFGIQECDPENKESVSLMKSMNNWLGTTK